MHKFVTPIDEVYIFSAPSLKANRLTSLFTGDRIEVLQESPTWLQIRSALNVQGWIPTHSVQTFKTEPLETEFYLSWPTDYPIITQRYNANPQWYAQYGLPGHEGLDIKAPMNSNIYACAPGRVSMIGTNLNHAYGLHIRVKHQDNYETIYAHLTSVNVNKDEFVNRKQLIGKANSTGNSTGSHLHLTLKHLGATARGETNFPNDIIDPTKFLIKD